MNGKRAKHLRKVAQGFLPQATPVAFQKLTPSRIFVPLTELLHGGKSAVFLGVRKLSEGCHRLMYKDLKHAYKLGGAR